MPLLFEYKGIDQTGKSKKGFIEADAIKAARSKLKKQGILVTHIVEKTIQSKKNTSSFLPFMGQVSSRELALMTRQLASLIKANIPLVEALNALIDQIDHERLKIILSQIRQDVNEGSSLTKATAAHPQIFDTLFVNMIEAGESSGALGLVLLRLADLKEAQMRLKSKILNAMTYPALMLVIGTGLMLAIFTFVMPKFTNIFESMHRPIPPLTQFLLDFSQLLLDRWYLFLGSGLLAYYLFRRSIQTQPGRHRWDQFKLRLPILGSLIRMIAVTRFSKTMSTLLSSGVPILTGMNIAKNLVDNVPIAQAISHAQENITEGQSMAEPLKKSKEFPPMMIHMIAIGEKTGELPDMLETIADTYEEQINAKIETLTGLLEPIMIVGLGGAVGFIMLSVFLPLLDMMNITQR